MSARNVLDMRRAAADVEHGDRRRACGEKSPVIVARRSSAERRLFLPDPRCSASRASIEASLALAIHRQIAFSLRQANNTMRSSSKPSRKREICVSP